MENKLRSDLNYKKTITVLSVLAALFGAFCALVGELCLPLAAAALAALYLYDSDSSKRPSVFISAAVLLVGVAATVLTRGYMAVLAVEAIVLALIISRMYARSASKAECAFYSTIAVSLLTVVSFLVVPCLRAGEISIDVVKTFYTDLYETLKVSFVQSFSELAATLPEEYGFSDITSETVAEAFDSALYSLISFVVIFGFVISGVAIKIFCRLLRRIDSAPDKVDGWRFVTTSLYAYFYMLLTVLNVFVTGLEGILPIAISILYLIFLAIYLYVGWTAIYKYLSQKRSKVLTVVIMIIALVCLSTFALQFLALIGAFSTVHYNRRHSADQGN